MAGKRLYPTHVPLGPAAKMLLTAGAAAGAFLYPQRADLVAAAGELTGEAAFRQVRARMLADATGNLILRERPIVSVRSLACYLSTAPRMGTLAEKPLPLRSYLAVHWGR